MARNANNSMGNNMFMGGGDGSYVSAERLKQADIGTETLLGSLNGAIGGVAVGAVGSAIFSIGQELSKDAAPVSANAEEGIKLVKPVFTKMFSTHLGFIAAVTALMAGIGGFVRHSAAVKHNEWSDKHYAYLAQANQENGFADKVEKERETAEADKGKGQNRTG